VVTGRRLFSSTRVNHNHGAGRVVQHGESPAPGASRGAGLARRVRRRAAVRRATAQPGPRRHGRTRRPPRTGRRGSVPSARRTRVVPPPARRPTGRDPPDLGTHLRRRPRRRTTLARDGRCREVILRKPNEGGPWRLTASEIVASASTTSGNGHVQDDDQRGRHDLQPHQRPEPGTGKVTGVGPDSHGHVEPLASEPAATRRRMPRSMPRDMT
jgi:hypothetical protein